MEFAGIIAEYDPFHNGHAAQLQMLRARGRGTHRRVYQRGRRAAGRVPAAAGTGAGCRRPCRAGADLVAALPAPYACLGAEGLCRRRRGAADRPGLRHAGLWRRDPRRRPADARRAPGGQLRPGRGAAAASGGRRDLCGGPRRPRPRNWNPGTGALLASPNNILGGGILQGHPAAGQPPAAFAAAPPGRRPRHLPRPAPSRGGRWPRPATCGSWPGGGGWMPRWNLWPAQAAALYRAAADRGELLDPDKFSVAVLSRLRGQGRQQLAAVRGLSEGLENRLYGRGAESRHRAGIVRSAQDPALPPRPAASAGAGRGAGGHGGACAPNAAPTCMCWGPGGRRWGLLRYAALPAGTSLAELARGFAPAEAVAQLHGAFADLSALCRQRPMPAGLAFTAKPVII